MIDLHIHSSYSDGKFNIKELSDQIIAANIKYCSITDHDNIDGLIEMKRIMENNQIVFINGVEFSVLYQKQEIHILVYDFNIEEMSTVLKKRNQIVENKRSEELIATIDLFKKEGFLVSDKIKLKNKKTIGLQIALDVYDNKKNQELMIKRHGHLLNEKEFYDQYQAPERPCYVLKSGVDLNWFLENLKNIKCDKILAHPFVPVSFLVKPLEKTDIDYLINRGLNGIEVYHDRNTVEQIIFLKRYIKDNHLLFTGGSDYHGKIDDTVIGYYGIDKIIPEFKLTNYKL